MMPRSMFVFPELLLVIRPPCIHIPAGRFLFIKAHTVSDKVGFKNVGTAAIVLQD
jgi:hypothetical protein